MTDNGTLRPDTDAGHWHALLAALQGGLVLAQAQHTTTALEAGLDTVIDASPDTQPPTNRVRRAVERLLG